MLAQHPRPSLISGHDWRYVERKQKLGIKMNLAANIKYHSVAIFVRNIEISKKFYIGILEQVIDLDFGTNIGLKSGISIWKINPNHIIPKQLGIESIANEKINRFELYFETENIESVFEKLKENNVELLHSIHEESWGQRTIRFYDPDKHLIEIGETLETFGKRLSDENMTPEQVSEKTSIPLSTVKQLIKK
ncbi:MAG: glyoxalase/bleomycin resistance/dioxygenase family protein [Candidatus Riflebacteria bacterium]|nr:glyoxalase/bleomycin resistance/dioxygenase family protein [Candidatus Riflebacteria bacterium]